MGRVEKKNHTLMNAEGPLSAPRPPTCACLRCSLSTSMPSFSISVRIRPNSTQFSW